MRDPQAIAPAALAGALPAGALGFVMGVPTEVLFFGLVGGLVAVLVLPRPKAKSNVKAALSIGAQLLAAVLCAMAMAEFTAAYLGAIMTALGSQPIPHDLQVRAASFVWGAGTQTLVQTVVSVAQRRLDSLGG